MKPYFHHPAAAAGRPVWTQEPGENQKILLLSCLDIEVWEKKELFLRKCNTTEWAELHKIQSQQTAAGSLLPRKFLEVSQICKGFPPHGDATLATILGTVHIVYHQRQSLLGKFDTNQMEQTHNFCIYMPYRKEKIMR